MVKNNLEKENQTTFVKDLIERRVPQILGLYFGTCWVVIEFTDWLVNRYVLSPYLIDLILVALLSMVPTVVILAYFHGKPGRDKRTKLETIGISANLLLTVALIFFLFSGRDLGAASKSVTLKDEEGNSIERVIPKSEFRKGVASFFFENEEGDSTLDWLQYAIPYLVCYDLLQDTFIETRDGYELYNRVKREGFLEGIDLPLTLKMKIANNLHLNFILSGSIKKQDKDYVIETFLHESRRGKLITQNTFAGTDIFQFADEISLQLKHDLEIPTHHIEEIKDLPVSELATHSIPALRIYMKGMEESIFHNDFQSASEYFEQSIREDPQFALAHLHLFVMLANANETEKSKAPFQAAMQYIYKFPERLQFRIKAMHYLVNEEKDKRLAVLKMWTEMFPEDITAHQDLADFYRNENQLDKAISGYKRILEIDPEQYMYIHRIGDLFMQKQNYEKALEYYEQYADQFPNESLSFTRLGGFYEAQGLYEEAKVNYEKALLIDSEEIATMISLADIERKTGNFDKALEQYQTALENSKTPEHRSNVYNSLEEYYELRGQINKSIEYMHLEWGEQEKFWSPLNRQLNKLFDLRQYAKAGKEDIAFEAIQDIKLYSPFDRAISIGYLLLYMELEDADNIDKNLEEAEETVLVLGFGDVRAIIYAGQAILHELRDEYDLAIQDYDKAQDIDPDNPLIATSIGRCYRNQKDYEKAQDSLIRVLKILPYYPEALYELALVYREQEENEKALEYLNKALTIWEDADPEYEPAKKARDKLAEWESEISRWSDP
jgi:tetratricopeptide (TPR) repeat protein